MRIQSLPAEIHSIERLVARGAEAFRSLRHRIGAQSSKRRSIPFPRGYARASRAIAQDQILGLVIIGNQTEEKANRSLRETGRSYG